jgi:uncharacterized protein DUF3592
MFFFRVRHWCYAAFAAGICLSIVALGSGVYFLNLRFHSLVTTGSIISVDRESNSDGYLYCPKVRFRAADEVTYTVPCRVWVDRHFAVGDVVLIRYSKADPNDAWPESQVLTLPRETALWGAFSLCLGFALRWYARRRGISLKFLG